MLFGTLSASLCKLRHPHNLSTSIHWCGFSHSSHPWLRYCPGIPSGDTCRKHSTCHILVSVWYQLCLFHLPAIPHYVIALCLSFQSVRRRPGDVYWLSLVGCKRGCFRVKLRRHVPSQNNKRSPTPAPAGSNIPGKDRSH